MIDLRISGPLFALLAICALVLSAQGAEPSPDFVVKAEKVEASVTLDTGIKADPSLSADLLSEGQRWARKEQAEGVEARRGESPNLVDWRYLRDYRTLSVISNRYVSILRTDSWSMGHGYDINTVLWDRLKHRRMSIRPFFRETSNGGPTLTTMQTAIIAALKTALEARGQEIADDSQYKSKFIRNLLEIGPVSLAPSSEPGKSSGLVFHYGHTYLGGYSEGRFEPFVPWETLKPYLTAEGIRIFGGTRPKGDDDGRR